MLIEVVSITLFYIKSSALQTNKSETKIKRNCILYKKTQVVQSCNYKNKVQHTKWFYNLKA